MTFGDSVKKALKAGNMVFGDGISRQVQHDYRLAEMAQETQYQMAQLELRNNQSRDLQVIMQELRIDFERARRRMESSPFFHDDLDTADLLWQEFKSEDKPLFLVSPFWDETKTNIAADAGGGDSHFRTAISGAWHEFEYNSHGVCLDGLFKRSLRQTDVDIRWIRNLLKDLPIILAYGYTDGKSVYPMIATWNILPNANSNQIASFHGKALLPSDHEDEDFRLHIGQAMIGVAGVVMGITEDGKNLYLEERQRRVPVEEILANIPSTQIVPAPNLFSQITLAFNSRKAKGNILRGSDLLGQLKTKAQEFKTEALKFKNKDFLNAAMAGSALIAMADGSINTEEKQKMLKFIESNDALSIFPTIDVIKTFQEFVSNFEFDKDIGEIKAYQAIGKIKSNNDAARLLIRMIMAIAASGNDFNVTKKKVTKKIANELGLNPSEFEP